MKYPDSEIFQSQPLNCQSWLGRSTMGYYNNEQQAIRRSQDDQHNKIDSEPNSLWQGAYDSRIPANQYPQQGAYDSRMPTNQYQQQGGYDSRMPANQYQQQGGYD